MAVDKLVDSAQLNADLTSVANAIRAKGGTSAALAFPAGFVSAIGDIPSDGGLNYEIGSFVLEEDTNGNVLHGIPHSLGEVPGCVIVWTEDYTVENPPAEALAAGYVLLHGLFNDFGQRLSSSAQSAGNLYVPFTINTTPAVTASVPSSGSYFLLPSRAPTDEVFYLSYAGANTYWRAGVTYHYFVSEAWWGND